MIDSLANVDMPRPPAPSRRESRNAMDFNQMIERAASDAAARDAKQGESHLLEVQVLDRDGQALAILLPWRLAANDALSQWMGAGGDVGDPARAPRSGASSTVAMNAPASATPDVDAWAPASPTPKAWTPPSWVRGTAATTLVTAAGDGDASVSAALSTLAEPWQARLLRWLQGGDTGLTARLRDYRLDPADEARFVERTVAFARENALALQRIVVNAREVWRAP